MFFCLIPPRGVSGASASFFALKAYSWQRQTSVLSIRAADGGWRGPRGRRPGEETDWEQVDGSARILHIPRDAITHCISGAVSLLTAVSPPGRALTLRLLTHTDTRLTQSSVRLTTTYHRWFVRMDWPPKTIFQAGLFQSRAEIRSWCWVLRLVVTELRNQSKKKTLDKNTETQPYRKNNKEKPKCLFTLN